MRDVVGMSRSFDYAPGAVLRDLAACPAAARDLGRLAAWAAPWKRQVTGAFQRAYLDAVAGAPFIPQDAAHLALMLDFHTLERVVYELGYELDNRPDWVEIPLRGLGAFDVPSMP